MKLRFTLLLFFYFSFFIFHSSAQPFFNRYDSIPVTINSNTLKYPWAGGLNSCQFSTIDMNMDGLEDLFVFDRAGSKVSTFINNGTPGMVDYTFAPQYRSHFVNQHDDRSTFHDWILLRDYDLDGKKDIFTYSNGATAVYRNTTETADSITFELMTAFMKSNYNPNYLALYISPVDMPTFIDVDDDGDLDVLTFHIFGTVVEFHSNQSQELYGHSDSLAFMLYDQCWGDFSENSSSNSVYLNTCIDSLQNEGLRRGGSRHSGSSTLALDMNNDSVKEFILGDLSFSNLTLLSNDGTLLDAHMFEQNVAAPPGTTATDLNIFPAAFYEDINNDNAKDLIVSPNTTNITENFNSVWLYKNNGITSLPEFEYVQQNFLQENMIEVGEVSFPVFFDADNDGLQDLIIGNKGYYSSTGNYPSKLSYYRNTGTATNPSFQLITRDYAGIETPHALGIISLVPTFGDIDGDDVPEMFIGDSEGELHLFENNAQPGQAANFVLSQPNYLDVGLNAAPQLFDVNGDTLLDLLIGERNGNLNYYENTGTANIPFFTLISEEFGGVDVRKPGFNIGYSVPFMFKLNNQLQLFAGSESGDIYQYIGIEETLDAPPLLTSEIGQGTIVSTDAETTPFGSQYKNGRNQFLIKGEEMLTAGFQNGIIESIAFNVETAAEGTIRNFKIGLINTNDTALAEFNEQLFTTVYYADVVTAQGWNELMLDYNFTWNGHSNLLVQVCFDTTILATANSTVYCTSTPFASNLAASTDNAVGCTMASTVAYSLRPNMKLSLKPSFPKKGTLQLFEGVRSSVCGTDLNNDSLMDIVIGNYTGGVSYYGGGTTGITTGITKHENKTIEASLFPNPCNENTTLNFSEPLNELVSGGIYNLTGQLVSSFLLQKGEVNFILNTSSFASGIYVLVASTKSRSIVKKFVVSH